MLTLMPRVQDGRWGGKRCTTRQSRGPHAPHVTCTACHLLRWCVYLALKSWSSPTAREVSTHGPIGSERYEDEMQAAAEADRRQRIREQRGESTAAEEEKGEAAAQGGAGGYVKAEEGGGGHAENIVGAPVPPKDKGM